MKSNEVNAEILRMGKVRYKARERDLRKRALDGCYNIPAFDTLPQIDRESIFEAIYNILNSIERN